MLLATCSAGAGAIGFACGLDVVGGGSPPPIVVDTGTEVTPNLPESGGSDGTTAPDVDAGPPCVESGRGPTMVVVPDAGFCIDSTEVTNGQYDDFLRATDASVSSPALDGGLPDACALAVTFNRKGAPGIDGGDPTLPVNRITWCDAFMYCRWAGKHLCAGVSADRDAASGEWYSACSQNGAQRYPYGANFQDAACWENDPGGTVHPVKTKATCEGPPGAFDMSGNVREWVDSCDVIDQCFMVGSTYASVTNGTSSVGSCREAYDYGRFGFDPTIGFRCCAPSK